MRNSTIGSLNKKLMEIAVGKVHAFCNSDADASVQIRGHCSTGRPASTASCWRRDAYCWLSKWARNRKLLLCVLGPQHRETAMATGKEIWQAADAAQGAARSANIMRFYALNRMLSEAEGTALIEADAQAAEQLRELQAHVEKLVAMLAPAQQGKRASSSLRRMVGATSGSHPTTWKTIERQQKSRPAAAPLMCLLISLPIG